MHAPIAPLAAAVLLALSPALIAPSPAPAQTSPAQPPAERPDSEPRDDPAALRQRIRELERELAEAQRRIADLERFIRELDPPDPTDPGEPQIDLQVVEPLASPDALLAHLRVQYEHFADEHGPFETERERNAYLLRLRRWVATMNQRYRGTVDWTCRVAARQRLADGDTFLDLVVLDDEGRALSERFVVVVPSRMRAAAERLVVNEGARVRGVMRPKVRLNEDRQTAGAFDIPPFIGAFVEYDFEVQMTSLVRTSLPTPGEPEPETGEPPRR
jgi:hypothetical protein